MRRLWAILACGLLALPATPAALGAGPGTLAVDDKAAAFTPDGVAKAKGLMESASFQAPAHLTVMTGGDKDVPASLKVAFDAAKQTKDSAAGRKVVGDWAADAALQHPDKGVFVLVYTEGKSAFVYVKSDRTTDLRGFGREDDRKLEQQLAAAFKAGDKDQGLYEATAYVVDRLKNSTVPAKTATPAAGEPARNQRGGSNVSLGGLICFGLLAAGVVWLIFGVIRALTQPRGGYGPGGYGGGGYGGGGYGGGGGGFMSGMMGGLFGAVAGNYLYNNFMGGGSSLGASGMDSGGYGGAGGYPDASGGDGDYAGGSEGGGAGGFDDADAGAGGFDDGGGAGGFDDAGGGDWGGGGDSGGGDGGGGGGGDW